MLAKRRGVAGRLQGSRRSDDVLEPGQASFSEHEPARVVCQCDDAEKTNDEREW
jgi:hypothetical protein